MYVCMYINRVIDFVCINLVLGGGLVVCEELYSLGLIDSSVVVVLSPYSSSFLLTYIQTTKKFKE